MQFKDFMSTSYTAYHAVANVISTLEQNNFKKLNPSCKWEIVPGGKYYVVEDGSAVIAFIAGENRYNIVAAHTDSPALKLKGNPEMKDGNYVKLNCEVYGGGLLYSFLDRPLRLAGRIVTADANGKISAKNVLSDFTVAIPSVAIHMNREANKGLSLNPQVDTLPLFSMNKDSNVLNALTKNILKEGETVLESDIFVISDTQPFTWGENGEFFSCPRLDDLCGVYAAVEALLNYNGTATAIAACFDNEEVGSSTKQGAGGTFLKNTIKRISEALGGSFERNLPSSMMVSMDNAHALHPNHPEKNDPTTKPVMNGGIVIKHHANQNYTTDAFSSAVIKQIFNKAEVKYQDFYMRSDMPCGGTLGAISSRQISVRSVDIGLAQLAMHSACETIGSSDTENLIKGLTAFYNSKLSANDYNEFTVEE